MDEENLKFQLEPESRPKRQKSPTDGTHLQNEVLECALLAAEQWAPHAVLRGGWFLLFLQNKLELSRNWTCLKQVRREGVVSGAGERGRVFETFSFTYYSAA